MSAYRSVITQHWVSGRPLRRWRDYDNSSWCGLMSLVVPLPLRALNPGGVELPAAMPLLPAAALAGALVTEVTGVVRIEKLHPSIEMVTSLRWRHIQRACTALLADGRLAVLLLGDLAQPVLDVLALPAEDKHLQTNGIQDGVAFSTILGRMLARGAEHGLITITEGDLAWLHPRLDPGSPEYYGA